MHTALHPRRSSLQGSTNPVVTLPKKVDIGLQLQPAFLFFEVVANRLGSIRNGNAMTVPVCVNIAGIRTGKQKNGPPKKLTVPELRISGLNYFHCLRIAVERQLAANDELRRTYAPRNLEETWQRDGKIVKKCFVPACTGVTQDQQGFLVTVLVDEGENFPGIILLSAQGHSPEKTKAWLKDFFGPICDPNTRRCRSEAEWIRTLSQLGLFLPREEAFIRAEHPEIFSRLTIRIV